MVTGLVARASVPERTDYPCGICGRVLRSARTRVAHKKGVHDARADHALARASRKERADLVAGFRAWLTGCAYVTSGRYRLLVAVPKRGGTILGPSMKDAGSAPWGATVRMCFPDSMEFANAARRWLAAVPESRRPWMWGLRVWGRVKVDLT